MTLRISAPVFIACLLFFAHGPEPVGSAPIKTADYEGQIRVACVGDSITFGAGVRDRSRNSYPAQLGALLGEKWDVRNFGHSARTMLKRVNPSYWDSPQFKLAQQFKPHVVIIKLGTNDVKPHYRETLERDFEKDYEAMIDLFAAMKTKPRVYICYPAPVIDKGNFGIKDPPVREFVIPTVDRLHKKKGTPIIDLYNTLKPFPQYLPDKIHPNADGAGVMARAIHQTLTGSGGADKDGFRALFNRKDLTGWQTTGNWLVEKDGSVALHPRPGESGWMRYKDYITTKRKYDNFVLDLDFKINAKGNSGVFLRVGDPNSQVKSGFEVQILDTHGKKNPTAHDCGGVIGTAAPSKNMAKPAGEWNHYTITCNGNQLTVVLNGERIIDLDLSKSAVKDRPLSGHIGFQDEGKPVWYRNVRVKELKPAA
ncbi:MAG: family 16 glycoside hydrolase [Pirellulales bacterium]